MGNHSRIALALRRRQNLHPIALSGSDHALNHRVVERRRGRIPVLGLGKLLREWEDGSTDELENPIGHVNYTKKHGPHKVTNIGTSRYLNALTELKD